MEQLEKMEIALTFDKETFLKTEKFDKDLEVYFEV